MSDFKCPVCGKRFSNKSAVCQDWRIPEQSFGCPHCQNFFIVEGTPMHWSDFLFPAAAFLLMVIEYFDLWLPAALATPTLLGIPACVYLYFLWKRRKTPAFKLVPVADQGTA